MRTILVATVVAAAALNAPAARADHEDFDCRLAAVADQHLTGGDTSYVGLATGYVNVRANEPVSIRCFVTVDGVDVSSTPTIAGVSTAATAGKVTFTAADRADVNICAEWTAGAEGGTSCFRTSPPLLCAVLKVVDTLALDVRGVVDIEDDGDVTVHHIPIIDCPPQDQPGGLPVEDQVIFG